MVFNYLVLINFLKILLSKYDNVFLVYLYTYEVYNHKYLKNQQTHIFLDYYNNLEFAE